jgi:hypothetical protein
VLAQNHLPLLSPVELLVLVSVALLLLLEELEPLGAVALPWFVVVSVVTLLLTLYEGEFGLVTVLLLVLFSSLVPPWF